MGELGGPAVDLYRSSSGWIDPQRSFDLPVSERSRRFHLFNNLSITPRRRRMKNSAMPPRVPIPNHSTTVMVLLHVGTLV